VVLASISLLYPLSFSLSLLLLFSLVFSIHEILGSLSLRPLPRSRRYNIQEWIKVIPYYIKEIIRLEGGNKYKEERKKGQEKVVVYS
jgi:hypothetical protein